MNISIKNVTLSIIFLLIRTFVCVKCMNGYVRFCCFPAYRYYHSKLNLPLYFRILTSK